MEYSCLLLNEVADYVTQKISIEDISTRNYISTDR